MPRTFGASTLKRLLLFVTAKSKGIDLSTREFESNYTAYYKGYAYKLSRA